MIYNVNVINCACWKKYLIIATVLTIAVAFIDWHISVGIVLGTLVYFLNIFLSSKKFPNLNSKEIAVFKILAIISLEGIIVMGMAVGTYFIGGLPCFFGGFGAMIIPNIYFFIFGK